MSATVWWFARIAAGRIPAQVVWQDEHALAFRDIRPQAPVYTCFVIPEATLRRPLGSRGCRRAVLPGLAKAIRDGGLRRGAWTEAATGSSPTPVPTRARRCLTCTSTCSAGDLGPCFRKRGRGRRRGQER